MKMRTRRKHAPWMHGGAAFRSQADWIWHRKFVKMQRDLDRAFAAAFVNTFMDAFANCWSLAYGRVDKENLAGGRNGH